MPRKAKAYMRKWLAEAVVDSKMQKLSRAYGKFGLVVEGESKKELRKGHGVLTGTLRRSIHMAGPDYEFSQDDVEPSSGSPERGGQTVEAAVRRRRLSLRVGSGLKYALKIHNGFGGFKGYRYLTLGLKRAKPQLDGILKQEVGND